jgi:hypothetical protein
VLKCHLSKWMTARECKTAQAGKHLFSKHVLLIDWGFLENMVY